jgi:dTDP-4-dehydrorhamnose reductase
MKIILFGSTGMLGNYVYKVLSENYIVITITRKEFDIENDLWNKLSNLLQKEYNDVQTIINCAGIIPQNCATIDYRKYIRINTLFPHKLQELSTKYNYKFIHITTDCVYDGLKGNYIETDLHSETGIYGVSKSLGEPEDACIIRTSIIGEELLNKRSLLEWLISQQNNKIDGYANHIWNGVTCLALAEIVKDIIDNNKYWIGVRHIYSPISISKYELCVYINEIYNLNLTIEKVNAKSNIDRSLKSNYAMNFNIKNIENQIIDLFNYTIINKTNSHIDE